MNDTTVPAPLEGDRLPLALRGLLGQNSLGGIASAPHRAQRMPVSRPARASSKKRFR